MRFPWLGAVLLLGAPFAAVQASVPPLPGERLEYRVDYRGVLSNWKPVEVARATLASRGVADRPGLVESQLQVSSEPFAAIEKVYAFRFFYSSWFEPGARRTLLVTQYKKSGRERSELLRFDYGSRQVERYRRDKGGAGDIAAEVREAGGLPGPLLLGRLTRVGAEPIAGEALLDRLAMFQLLRGESPAEGGMLELPVSNGKGLTGYRVTGLGEAWVDLPDGTRLPADKVRLDPLYGESTGEGLPVYAWLGRDGRRLPLRLGAESSLWAVEATLAGLPDRIGEKASAALDSSTEER